MEQRIGSNKPLAAAAVDPSHIPGLTAPVSVKKEKQEEPEDIKPTESVEPDKTASERDETSATEKASLDKTSDEAEDDDEPDSEAEAESDAVDEEADDADDADDAEESDDEADDEGEDTADDGPVFEASDRRAKIVADSRGVRLRLDDQECEFRWDEIGAIETESPRFGKRFTVTVHTPDRRWYPIEIEAKAKSEHAAWETTIDQVLDAYFEEESEDSAP